MPTGSSYTVKLHVDDTNNIVLDGIDVSSFDDPSSPAETSSWSSSVKVGDNPGRNQDTFEVRIDYPAAYAGPTGPTALTVSEHVQAAFTLIDDVITNSRFPGGGPSLVIATLGSLVAGSGYRNATYKSVNLTGGSGHGAVADITVAGGVVTVVTLVETGIGYQVGDVLSANLGVDGTVYPSYPGTGFSITVATLGSPITNTTYV